MFYVEYKTDDGWKIWKEDIDNAHAAFDIFAMLIGASYRYEARIGYDASKE